MLLLQQTVKLSTNDEIALFLQWIIAIYQNLLNAKGLTEPCQPYRWKDPGSGATLKQWEKKLDVQEYAPPGSLAAESLLSTLQEAEPEEYK